MDIQKEEVEKLETWYGAACALCGFEYKEFNQSIIPCPLCKIEDLQVQLATAQETICGLREALEDILAVCRDREAFVMQGPRAFAKAEQIASKALAGK